MYRIAAIGFASLLLAGCANPLNQATSQRYDEICTIAERNGKLEVAEDACHRALVNVDWGNLGPEMKSQKQYNLARIKRKLGKFEEADILLKDSLEIEEALSGKADPKVGRRIIELTASLAQQEKWLEGAEWLTKALPSADKFSGGERDFVIFSLSMYSEKMNELNRPDLAQEFKNWSEKLSSP